MYTLSPSTDPRKQQKQNKHQLCRPSAHSISHTELWTLLPVTSSLFPLVQVTKRPGMTRYTHHSNTNPDLYGTCSPYSATR